MKAVILSALMLSSLVVFAQRESNTDHREKTRKERRETKSRNLKEEKQTLAYSNNTSRRNGNRSSYLRMITNKRRTVTIPARKA